MSRGALLLIHQIIVDRTAGKELRPQREIRHGGVFAKCSGVLQSPGAVFAPVSSEYRLLNSLVIRNSAGDGILQYPGASPLGNL